MIEKIPSQRLRHAVRVHVKYAKRPRRYRHLLMLADAKQPRVILEIGVYTGLRAVEMIEAASLARPASRIAYHGFDLFEHMNEEILAEELSKVPDPMPEVEARLKATGASIALHKGWSQETLPAFRAAHPDVKADLVFIDGGHAVETIRSDWENVIPLLADDAYVLFDDYYVDCPHLTDEFGCNQLIESLDRKQWTSRVYPDVDRFVHDGKPFNVSIVEVRRSA